MRILFLNHNFRQEGTYFRAFNFARGLAGLGHDITLMTVSRNRHFTSSSSTEDGVKIIETPRFLDMDRGGWAPLDTAKRLLHTAANSYDIVHGFDHKPNVYFPLLCAGFFHKKTVLFSDWADWWTKGGMSVGLRPTPEILIETFLEEDVRRRVRGLTVTSLALRDRAESLGIKKERIFYLPSGCNVRDIRPLAGDEIYRIKKEKNLPVDKKILMFIGFGQSDLGMVIDAFGAAKSRRNDLALVIVGPLEKRLEPKVASCPARDSVIITGRVDFSEVAKYAAAADIFMLPLSDTVTNRGRGPIKAGDYMAAGKPVIASPVGDIASWIEKYRFGVCAATAGEMADAVISMLSDPSLMSEYGRNGRRAAEEVFSWEKAALSLENAYKKILSA